MREIGVWVLSAAFLVVAACSGLGGIKTEFSSMDGAKYAEAIKELVPVITDLVVGIITDLQAKAVQ
jgi:hypothetical protein